MEEFTIRKHDASRQVKERLSWPWKDMNVGDEVLVDDQSLIPKAMMSAYSHAKFSNKKFSTKRTDDGLVVWRVS